jgi:hypothetical protein
VIVVKQKYNKSAIRMVAGLYSLDNGATWYVHYVKNLWGNGKQLCCTDLVNQQLEFKGRKPDLDNWHSKNECGYGNAVVI